MATVILTSPCNRNLSQTFSFENKNNNLLDASFSSYLNGAEENFVLKPAEASRNLRSLITTPHEHLYLGRKKVEDGEIGVFAAEKYFNGRIDERNPRFAKKVAIRHQYKKDEAIDHKGPVKPKIKLGTLRAHDDSESSWNSRSVFLHSVLRNPSQRKTSKENARSFLSSLGCNCSCNDMNSVDVDENNSKTMAKELNKKTGLDSVDLAQINESQLNPWVKEEKHCKNFDKLGLGFDREDCFSFPVLKMHFQEEEEDDRPRKLLEAFGSPILEKGKKTLSMLIWEETEIPESSDRMFNDTGSDASSDLFEIESFKSNANPFLASDGVSCYAPSEASIEWSVVTASAADFSATSDSEELRAAATTTNPNKKVPTAKTMPAGEIQKWRPSLFGCKSYKAVRVAGDAYRTSEKAIPETRRHPRSDFFAPLTRFRAETELTGFDSRNRQHVFDAKSVSQSHSPCSSRPFYIQ